MKHSCHNFRSKTGQITWISRVKSKVVAKIENFKIRIFEKIEMAKSAKWRIQDRNQKIYQQVKVYFTAREQTTGGSNFAKKYDYYNVSLN